MTTPLPPDAPSEPPRLPPVGGAQPVPPSRSFLPILAVVAIVLVVAAVALLALRGPGVAQASASPTEQRSVRPSASGTPSPEPSPTGSESVSPSAVASEEPSPLSSAELARLEAAVAQVESEVPPIRGLQPERPVENHFLPESQLADELRASFDRDNPPDEVAEQSRLLQHLGFLEEGTDLRAIIIELLSSSVIGYYDPDQERMTIVQKSEGVGPLERFTVSHEYTHALQDQHFDLDSLGFDDTEQGDRSLARLSLIEGDATLLMFQWATQHLDAGEIAEIARASSDPEAAAVLARMPPIVVRQNLFPYLQGQTFVGLIQQQGGWQAVDAIYADPPDSTEQIIHPERFSQRDEPTTVELSDISTDLGDGWRQAVTDTFGELTTDIWLEQADHGDSDDAAAGWDGDRVALYEGPSDDWAVVWETVWDSPTDAAEFERAAVDAVAALGLVADVERGGGSDRVRVTIAKDGTLLTHLSQALR